MTSSDEKRGDDARTAQVLHDVEKAAVPGATVPIIDTPAPAHTSSVIDLDATNATTKEKDGSTTEKKPDPFAHLPEHEAAILRKQLDVPDLDVGYFTLYRYADRQDLIIIAISTLCAVVGGALMPLMLVIFGALSGTFQSAFQGTISLDSFNDKISHFTLYYLYIAIGMFVMLFVANAGFMWTGERITGRTRQNFLRAILRQNIGFFDKLGAGEVTTRITSDTNLIQAGISEKVPLLLQGLATFFAAFVIAFVRYWKLALILCSTIVAIVVCLTPIGKKVGDWAKVAIGEYGKGGTLAEEVLSSIRNAASFNAQDKLAHRYDAFLEAAYRVGVKQKSALGFLIGLMYLFIYLNYGLSFWMGSRFLVDGQMTLPQVITIQMVIIVAAFSLGSTSPSVQAMTSGIAAAKKVFNTIDRQSPLDSESDEGDKLDHVEGIIELRNIRHIYPSRPEVVVMEDVSLSVPAGKTTALVGASGSGKSTIVGLVERFYDPVQGKVFLDGVDVSTLNLRWLRQQIALVSQEPTLFAATIFENIAYGLLGTSHESDSTQSTRELVENAARTANAHDFISALPEGYETNVGERGFLLSGGQKQRIAIARAIVSDPKILLLDEATSALDTKSEGVVQAALDNAAQGRTTIVIAHRLSTIKNADNIVVMSRGTIVEQGTHHQLLQKKGAYHILVEAQQLAIEKETEEEHTDSEELEGPEKITRQLSRRSTGEDLNIKRTTSISSKVLKDKQLHDHKHHYSLWTLVKLIVSFNRKEWYFLVIGCLGCIITGGAEPVAAVFFAKSISALSLPPSQYGELRSQANFWSLMYLMLAFVIFIAYSIHGTAFAFCSERLIRRARDSSFRYMLRQDMAFFDQEKNSAGALSAFLSTEATHLAGISGVTLGTILTTLTTLIASCTVGLAIGWKLSLVCISTIPVLLGCGYLRFWLMHRFESMAKESYERSAAFACEASSAIRTVASLTREKDVCDQYAAKVQSQRRDGLKAILRSSSLFAGCQAMSTLVMALGFWYGGTLIGKGEYSIFQFFLCFTAIIFGAQSAGTIFAFAPDMGKARQAAASLKTLFDRKPEIDSWSQEGTAVAEMEGHIEFRDVHFRYPTRPETAVLRGLNLTVKPGQYIALVGPSGCGKSTTISLLERFYNPLSGGIFIDGQEVSTINLTDYRSRIALVSQEPTLYQGTIRENILLGAVDDSKVTDAEIEHACRSANIYDFITSLPDGFQTLVGSKGTLLSGGQKQRVAIARALLNDPRVLLLDEATSALDSESEKVVQEALDKAAKGRTTIAVAHRLSTIQRADMIYVFDQGRVAEQGTHAELMRRKGRYYELVNLQSLG
ncbi:multidrug/pheromone exporter, ABC superfamily [Myriangium duriaei CBS 260.36]|uniref:Multidrug/pheromone exporter, ABC superfamily n=1 Tax=Myriangium duriaei CBS 260.36 TaxID=1168546 RepID=A0A9P4JB44_9PEZI|nr:multidrug/pheromone exporter, ABC superfamily [Myriangium duriaei CBS 260.36]